MIRPDRTEMMKMMREILARQGAAPEITPESPLDTIGFRSLDFAELALKVEAKAGASLSFDGAAMRSIRTVGDVLEFLEKALAQP